MNLKDKVVIVTGASAGIGAAIAIKFAEQGSKVALAARNEIKLKEVAAKCEKHGAKVVTIVADVTDDCDIEKILITTISTFKRLDILVNNAGIAETAEIWDAKALEVYDRVMATNLRSVIYLTNLAAQELIKTKGNIINISSVAAMTATAPGYFAYCTSKAGLDHFTRAIATDLAPKGVRVNTVNPGPVRTDILRSITDTKDEDWKKAEAMTALGRVSDPNEVADLVLFLASDKAVAITGSSFVTDNGLLLHRG